MTDILVRLQQAGYQALIVGGYVRDKLLGVPCHDADLATDASPEVCRQLFDDARVELTGQHFRVLRIDGYELASFRGERYRVPGKPEVWPTDSFEADAARRDFTINAMALTLDGRLLDPFNGQADLRAGLVRAVGIAEQRFIEDPARLLRAVGFAVRLGFIIEENTAKAMRDCAEHLRELPAERMAAELELLIAHEVLPKGMELYQRFGFLPYVLPELSHLPQTRHYSKHHHLGVWGHTLEVLRYVTKKAPYDRSLLWAALFHDAGKGLPAATVQGEGGLVRYETHEQRSAQRMRSAAWRMALGRHLSREASFFALWHMPRGITEPGAAVRLLNLMAPTWRDKEELCQALERLFLLWEADCYGKRPSLLDEHLTVMKQRRDLLSTALQRVPLYLKDAGLHGTDLQGQVPDQDIGRLLRQKLLVLQSEQVQRWYDEYLPLDIPQCPLLPEGAVLRLATPQDVSKLHLLVNAAYAELGAMGLNFTGVTQDETVTLNRMKDREIWLIEKGERLLATIALKEEEPDPDRGEQQPAWYIAQFGVAPDQRGLHLGSLLMHHAFVTARQRGLSLLRLDTAVPAHHLVRFYRRFGFKTTWVVQWRGKTYPSFIMTAPSSFTIAPEKETTADA